MFNIIISKDRYGDTIASLPYYDEGYIVDYYRPIDEITSIRLEKIGYTGISTNIKFLTKLIEIHLVQSNIKSIPDDIGELTRLTVLDLAYNEVTSIPNTIGNLTNLTNLDLSNNQLTRIPDSIMNLTKLKNLNLNDNQLTTLPNIENLLNLEELLLDENQLTIFPDIRKLTKLKSLTLRDNLLTSVPYTIGNLTNLTELELRYNPLTTISAKITDLNLEKFELTLRTKVILTPIQETYFFTSELVLHKIADVFDIVKYNKLMNKHIRELNSLSKKKRDRLDSEVVERNKKHSIKNYAEGDELLPSDTFFHNERFINHVKEMLGEIPENLRTKEDVLLLKHGYEVGHGRKRRTKRKNRRTKRKTKRRIKR